MKKIAVILLVFIQITGLSAQKSLPQLGKSPVKDVVAALTLEEKVHLLVGPGMRMSDIADPTKKKPGETTEAPTGLPPGALNLTPGESKVPGAAGILYDVPRLGIPAIVVADGPAGLRINPFRKIAPDATFYCTAFPIESLLASSWDTQLVEKVGAAMGNEVREYGVDVLLGPALNIHRNPLGGRNFEYYSEDPLISGKMAAAMVRGVQSQGVGTSVKHFAANNSETNRMEINTLANDRTLREIYLRGFETVVKEAKPWTVMSSYNKLNGPYTSENRALITTTLRDEWGFGGLVMSDWFGGKDAVAQMKAGNDLLMPGRPDQMNAIMDAVKNGSLPMAVLDQNVEHLLNLILKTETFKKYKYSNKPDLKAHATIARNAATAGMVLLKNEQQTLPFDSKVKHVAVFGIASYDIFTGGTGSGDVNEAYSVSLPDGLKNAGYALDADLQQAYTQYIEQAKAARPPKKTFFDPVTALEEMVMNREKVAEKISGAEIVLLTIGRNAGEFFDRKMEAGDFLLTKKEKDLLDLVSETAHKQGKKLIVILNTGGIVEVASWRQSADAILLAWQGGQETGNAIADVLSGKVNPSGKLASTFPVRYDDVSSAKSFPGTPADKPTEIKYEDGIYVGYRHFDKAKTEPAYAFGFGLSYTTFAYNNLKISTKGSQITVSVDVQNSGKSAGQEVAQLYVSAPGKQLDKPEQELRGFAKTRLLKPGEKQTLRFTLKTDELASFDPTAKAWVTEAGEYKIRVGASSRDIRKTGAWTLAKAAQSGKFVSLEK
jgi:beta-glucosidase